MTTPEQTVPPGEVPASEPQTPATEPAGQQEGNVTELLAALKEEFSGKLAKLESDVKTATGRSSSLAQTQSEINKAQGSLREQLARLEQYKTQRNLSDEEAIVAMEADDAEGAWKTTLEKKLDDLASLISGGNGAKAEQSVANVFEEILGKDAMKDARVVDALGKNYGSANEASSTAYRLFHQISQSPNPNSAQEPSLNGASVHVDAQKLLAEMDELVKGNDMTAIKAKGEELRKAGIEGW